tara:strand:+ start:166 stop:786 length:621 start_codon:yes stop_codon:yes gene_type:complete
MRISNTSQLRAIIAEPHQSIREKKIAALDSQAVEFIEKSPFLVLSTTDEKGRQSVSPKGDHPGFVEIIDNAHLLIPDRPGNGLADSHLNILNNPRVGLIFFVPGTNESLRISGTAELHADAEKLEQMRARGKAALLTTRVTISEVFFHCGKALIRSELWTSNQSVAHHKVSFGQAYVERQKQSGLLAKTTVWAIDRLIRKDYKNNL